MVFVTSSSSEIKFSWLMILNRVRMVEIAGAGHNRRYKFLDCTFATTLLITAEADTETKKLGVATPTNPN